ncbi:MAG: nucleotidyltransferase domain-containing protein [Actinomycetota bacterium]
MSIEDWLRKAREAIEVTDDELKEARRRRELIAEELRVEFPGARVYFNGSLAHGDALDPLSDFDLGVVIPDPAQQFGPGKASADELKTRASGAIRRALIAEYPKLRVEVEGRKRSLLVRFSHPVTPRATDFTGDVICAVDHPVRGLWIPKDSTWDRSDPETHTRLVLEANKKTSAGFAKTVRLLKYWNGAHDGVFCSWHLKVLALPTVSSGPQIDSLRSFFAGAIRQVTAGPTPDPAFVGPSILPQVDAEEAVKRLREALDLVEAAIKAEAEGRPLGAQAELSNLLPEIVPAPDSSSLRDEERDAAKARLASRGSVSVGSGTEISLPRNRGWSDDPSPN